MDLERLSYTVDEGISAIGMGRFQYTLLAYAGVVALGKAMELMCMTYVGLAVHHDLELSITDQNIIFVFTYIAMVVGALIWGFLWTVREENMDTIDLVGCRPCSKTKGCLKKRMKGGVELAKKTSSQRAKKKKKIMSKNKDINPMDHKRLSYTVDEGISAIGMGRFQYTLLAYAGVGALGKAMELMCITYLGLAAQHDLELSITHQNIILSSLT
nr:organic cation/carnitine transporter 7-like [Tanacetum cinerariifolium]